MKAYDKNLRIAFVVGVFPAVSETFIINQIADLKDKGVGVDIFFLQKGSYENISERFWEYGMNKNAYSMEMPQNYIKRVLGALLILFKICFKKPLLLKEVLNIKKYGNFARSLKLLFMIDPWIDRMDSYDLIHCHFGTIANKFLLVDSVFGLDKKIICTFYGYDVSHVFQVKPENYYDALKDRASMFFVMSQNMKQRVVNAGFKEQKVEVLPVSIDVDSIDFSQREGGRSHTCRILSVGRFVEKKGFDDLIKALSVVKKKIGTKFKCTIIGGGALEKDLRSLVKKKNLEQDIVFKGYMKIEDVLETMASMDVFIQPSKTAKNGDME